MSWDKRTMTCVMREKVKDTQPIKALLFQKIMFSDEFWSSSAQEQMRSACVTTYSGQRSYLHLSYFWELHIYEYTYMYTHIYKMYVSFSGSMIFFLKKGLKPGLNWLEPGIVDVYGKAPLCVSGGWPGPCPSWSSKATWNYTYLKGIKQILSTQKRILFASS